MPRFVSKPRPLSFAIPPFPGSPRPYQPDAPAYDVCQLTPVEESPAVLRHFPGRDPYRYVYFYPSTMRAVSLQAAVQAALDEDMKHETPYPRPARYFGVWEHTSLRHITTRGPMPVPDGPAAELSLSAAVILVQGKLYRLPKSAAEAVEAFPNEH
ncbi:hypothetical protein [Streptomyces sp. NPDC087272]|uniref:hypothetical protein n=1 Tax=Streptomyces sp. NPDC087272 TaxID=3365775 RepID=UPI003810CDD7